MTGGEEAVCPGSVGAFDGSFLVIDEVVAEDLSFRGIGGDDLRLAVDDAMGLVEVDGLGDIVRNDGIVLPDFGDAIDLNG